MTATLGNRTRAASGAYHSTMTARQVTSGNGRPARHRGLAPAPAGRPGTASFGFSFLRTGAVICYPAKPPSSVVTHSASSVVATQTLTLRQETAPASMLPSEAVTSDQDLPPSAVPSSASFW
jgi:hypothetical protein